MEAESLKTAGRQLRRPIGATDPRRSWWQPSSPLPIPRLQSRRRLAAIAGLGSVRLAAIAHRRRHATPRWQPTEWHRADAELTLIVDETAKRAKVIRANRPAGWRSRKLRSPSPADV